MVPTMRSSADPRRVGGRVRVIVPAGRRCDECPHFDGEQGCTGQVVRATPVASAPGHPFLVMFDEPCYVEARHAGRLAITARHYAADELEPIG